MGKYLFEERRENLKRLLKEQGVSALLVSHAANRYYLSGFELHDAQCNESSGWLVITTDGADYLLTDPRYVDAAKEVWDEDHLVIYGGNKHRLVADLLKKQSITSLAIEAKAIHLFDYDKLNQFLSIQPQYEFVEKLRVIKDADEMRRMDASIALNHKLFDYIEGRLEPGRTEEDIAWDVEKFFRENGAEKLAFSTIVGVGPNAALPHAIPGETRLRENELVLIDTGCRFKKYNSDQTRTFWVGDKPSERFLKTKELVLASQQAAIDVIKPGVAFADAYKAAYQVFEKAGVESMFTHGLGHGVGLETHEAPSLSKVSKGVLEPGMVVTVEPGLYDPQWGGIRWEYQVFVTEEGCRVM